MDSLWLASGIIQPDGLGWESWLGAAVEQEGCLQRLPLLGARIPRASPPLPRGLTCFVLHLWAKTASQVWELGYAHGNPPVWISPASYHLSPPVGPMGASVRLLLLCVSRACDLVSCWLLATQDIWERCACLPMWISKHRYAWTCSTLILAACR